MTSKYATPFSVLHAASLLSHKSRLKKFQLAIEKVVCQGKTVLDIGTGSGILAILAARGGADRVIAIDINHESIEYAKAIAERNGYGEKIEFIQTHYEDLELQEKVDVVICEMISSFMLIEQQIPASILAMKHLLKPGGSIIPSKIILYGLLAQAPQYADRFDFDGIKFNRLPQTIEDETFQDLSSFEEVSEFDFSGESISTHINKTLEYEIIKDGTIHGLVGMFSAEFEDVMKLEMEDGWKPILLPLESEITVNKGDSVRIHLSFEPGKYDSLKIAGQIV